MGFLGSVRRSRADCFGLVSTSGARGSSPALSRIATVASKIELRSMRTSGQRPMIASNVASSQAARAGQCVLIQVSTRDNDTGSLSACEDATLEAIIGLWPEVRILR